MKKFILFLFLFFFISFPTNAKVLQGSVTYEANKAWETAMLYAEKKLPQEIIDSHLVDPDYEENQVAMKYKISQLGEKLITYYSDGTYAIGDPNHSSYGYIYDPNGNLGRILKIINTDEFRLIYFYETNNVLTAVSYDAKKGEAYVFDAKTGKLESYWINKKGYFVDGKIIEILN